MKKLTCRIGLVAAALLLSLSMEVATKSKAAAHASNSSMQAATIEVKDFSFQPRSLTVKAGTEVTWVNQDEEPHTVVSTDKMFASKALDTGERFSHTFSKSGEYEYFCSVHPKMVGTIIVKGNGSSSSDDRR